jgi:RNA 2',3'-cyclic 3'-phosphodiesterase
MPHRRCKFSKFVIPSQYHLKRLFAAIHLSPSEPFALALSELQAGLSSCRINWSQPSQLHLTLKFFGETPESAIPAITSTLLNTCNSFAPFKIQTGSLGIFGSAYKPRVIWVGFADAAILTHMGEAFLNVFAEAGFPRDRQNFVPHLTLGRIKEISLKSAFQQHLDTYRERFAAEFLVKEVILFESQLSARGATYLPLVHAPLKP